MARSKKATGKFLNTGNEEVPSGATPAAHDRPRKRGRGPAGSGGGSVHAAGTPAGGTAYGGLAGTNVGDGAPDDVELDELDEAMGAGIHDDAGGDEREDRPPYAGFSGGAVGGTPAEGRSSGGTIDGGFRASEPRRVESTIGSNPPRGKGRSREEVQQRQKRRARDNRSPAHDNE
jgi:hypothetical protein